MKRNRVRYLVPFLMLGSVVFLIAQFSLADTAKKSVKVTLSTPNSLFRIVDKKGDVVGAELIKRAMKSVGIGNIIFSVNPLPFEQEEKYENVGPEFRYDDLNALEARVYLPGENGDLIRFAEATYKNHKFLEKKNILLIYPPDGKTHTFITTYPVEEEEMGWDQQKLQLIPEDDEADFKEMGWKDICQPGITTVQAYSNFRFEAGTKMVTRDGNLEEEPNYAEYLVAYGAFKVNRPVPEKPILEKIMEEGEIKLPQFP